MALGRFVEIIAASPPRMRVEPYAVRESVFRAVLATLEPLIGQPSTKQLKAEGDARLAGLFREWEAEGERLMVADGMVITGARVVLGLHELNIRWKTGFWPAPRFSAPPGDLEALGFFEGYDLYVGRQSPMLATLIARYGNAPDAYVTFNPELLGRDTAILHGEMFVEALRRADLLGLLATREG